MNDVDFATIREYQKAVLAQAEQHRLAKQAQGSTRKSRPSLGRILRIISVAISTANK